MHGLCDAGHPRLGLGQGKRGLVLPSSGLSGARAGVLQGGLGSGRKLLGRTPPHFGLLHPSLDLLRPLPVARDGRREHGVARLIHGSDLALEPLGLLHRGAGAAAGVQVRAHTLEGVREAALLLQQARTELGKQAARHPAGHAGPQHLVELVPLLVSRKPLGRHAQIEQFREVLACGREPLDAVAVAGDGVAELVMLRHLIEFSLGQQ